MSERIRMNEDQFGRAKKLIRKSCCNFSQGECLCLDNGESCTCAQMITRTVVCKWFREAVLPLDPKLHSELVPIKSGKMCKTCGKPLYSRSSNIKYCSKCAYEEKKKRDAERKRKRRGDVLM